VKYRSEYPGWEYKLWTDKEVAKLKLRTQEEYDKANTPTLHTDRDTKGDSKRVVVLHYPHIRAMRLTGGRILQESMYQCKADLLRLEVLWNEGGVYIDADMVWLHKDLQVSCHACE